MRSAQEHNLQGERQHLRLGRRLGSTAPGRSPPARPETNTWGCPDRDLGDEETGERRGRGNSEGFLASASFLTRRPQLKKQSSIYEVFLLLLPLLNNLSPMAPDYHLASKRFLFEKKQMLLAGSWVGTWCTLRTLLLLPYRLDLLDGK